MHPSSYDLPRRRFLGYAAVGAATAALAPAIGQRTARAATTPGQASVGSGAAALRGQQVQLEWTQSASGWAVSSLLLHGSTGWRQVFTPSGTHGILTDLGATAPDADSVRHVTAGTHTQFLPGSVTAGPGALTFRADQPGGTLTSTWQIDPDFPSDIVVTATWSPAQDGWYSIPSPTLATLPDADLGWAVIPGYWSSATIEANSELTYQYNFGAPTVPLISNEQSTTSLVSVLQGAGTSAATLAVTADPSLARDPWESSASTQSVWHVGMSVRELGGTLSPTALYPLLGQDGSRVTAGQSVTATFRYTLTEQGWFDVTKHVTRDVYDLAAYTSRAVDLDSLSHRMNRMHDYLVSSSSQWHTWTYDGLTLGAESGKLSDVGAMWMLDAITGDPIVHNERLPYARNFKLAQQGSTPGPFYGAALGEYFRNNTWITDGEWANEPNVAYISPIFTTFYTLADMGNIALFEPDDTEIRDRLRLAADTLLSWQHDDGSFDVGYQRADPATLQYPELTDYRATWYGFIPAYRLLGDRKYLDAARLGADWFIANALKKGNFLGVCDDTRLATDFQVIFAAQALLDVYDITGEPQYRHAAVQVARFYTLHIFNHPTVTNSTRDFHGATVEDWQASQVGLNFEHAGYTGSSNANGPITIASHAGAFVRFFQLTHDTYFLDLARAAARGRDAFVGITSGIPSYYWAAGNGGSSVFPWHGWWHMGWLTDYLFAEANLRSRGAIDFPHGFCTAKVGSHVPYGFANGKVYGQEARFWMPRTLIAVDNPSVDWITARSADGGQLFVIALNESNAAATATVTLDPRGLVAGQLASWGTTKVLAGQATSGDANAWTVQLAGNGLAVLEIATTLADDPQGPQLRSFSLTGPDHAPVVSWSYWATVTSWAQWSLSGADDWTDTARQDGYSFTTTLDLSAVQEPATVDVRLATQLPGGTIGYSEPQQWWIPGADIALGRPVTVSSVYSSAYPGPNAVDGNTTSTASRWLSAVGDTAPTITVTLASITTPKLVRLISGTAASQVVVAFTVQALASDGTWTVIGSVSGNTQGIASVPVIPVQTDQVRVVITIPSTDPINVARVFELEIFDQV